MKHRERFTIVCNKCNSKNVVIKREYDYDFDEEILDTGYEYLEC